MSGRIYEASPVTGRPRLVRSRKLYQTIVVDPPWAYRDASFSRRGRRSVYEVQSERWVASLPLPEWAAPDAHLYLWTTNGFMREAFALADTWGFVQKTIVTWGKTQIGAGRYFRNNTEHALFCVRGRLPCLRKDVPTLLIAPRGRHSEKPAAFYDMVASMSPGPYLDVFARKQRFGWDTFGLEVYNEPELLETLTDAQREGLVSR